MANHSDLSRLTATSEAQSQHSAEQVRIRNLWNDRALYENYPRFQRKFVWPLKFKRALIDSILRGAPVPALFAYKTLDKDGKEKYWILDGHQRLATIYDFLRGEITTWTLGQAHHEEPNSLPPVEPGLHFHALSEHARNVFLSYQFTIALIDYEDEAQLGMYYRRIQHHLPLKMGEKLASYGSKAMECALQLQQHAIWTSPFYYGDNKRNETLSGSLALLSTQMRQGCISVTSSSLHRVASGLKDTLMTQALYDTVATRLDVAMCVFDGTVVVHPMEIILLYQAIMFLENRGFTFTTSDKGYLTDWFGQLQARAAREGKRGFSYGLGDRLREGIQQEDFWERYLPELIALCEQRPDNAA